MLVQFDLENIAQGNGEGPIPCRGMIPCAARQLTDSAAGLRSWPQLRVFYSPIWPIPVKSRFRGILEITMDHGDVRLGVTPGWPGKSSGSAIAPVPSSPAGTGVSSAPPLSVGSPRETGTCCSRSRFLCCGT